MAFQDFDQISQRRQLQRKQKLRRRIIIGVVVSVVLVLLAGSIIGVVMYRDNQNTSSQHKNHDSPAAPKAVNAVQKEVQTVCAATDYKKICRDRLLKALNKTSSPLPKDILKATFTVPSEEIRKAIKQASSQKYDAPIEQAALEDCLVLLDDAIAELNESTSSIKGMDLAKLSSKAPDLNNRLSAVLSHQQTCIDGFPEGKEKAEMEKLLKDAKVLSSNALAIVSHVVSIFSTFKGPESQRELLGLNQDGSPSWMSREDRRFLKDKPKKLTPNVTVAKDGSGNFDTISGALNSMPKTHTGR